MLTATREAHAERELRIQSRIEDIRLVERFVEELNTSFGFKDDVFANIMVAVTEAVNNGIVHGNREDAHKTVTLTCRMLNPFLLSITVKDEGPGFDYHQMPDPTDPLNLLQERGRGVFVMSHLADDIQYRGIGNEVEMRFNI